MQFLLHARSLIHMATLRWTHDEERALGKLSTPEKVQDFLDRTPYRCEDGYFPPVDVLRNGRAHCFDGALLAYAALNRGDFQPRIIDLCSIRDDDHLLCVYRWRNRWGAVAKSNFPGLRFREPIFKNARELVLSFFEFYFNLEGEKSLRAFSSPLRLPSVRQSDWECDKIESEKILSLLEAAPHHDLLLPNQSKSLRPTDKRQFRSQMVGVDLKGAYGGKV